MPKIYFEWELIKNETNITPAIFRWQVPSGWIITLLNRKNSRSYQSFMIQDPNHEWEV